jgi:hypothetical protein
MKFENFLFFFGFPRRSMIKNMGFRLRAVVAQTVSKELEACKWQTSAQTLTKCKLLDFRLVHH